MFGGRGVNEMIIQTIKLLKLKPSDYNPRCIDEDSLRGLTASIDEFGCVEPIIWNKQTGNIVGGHQRLKVLKEKKIKETEVVVVDLPMEREKALNVALNVALNNRHIQGDWTAGLGLILDEVKTDLPDLYENLNFDVLIDDIPEIPEPVIAGNTDPNAVPPVPEESVIRIGDLIKLGNHKVLCGDSVKKEDVEKLMVGEKADMIFTDPPYALFGNSTGVAGIVDDKMTRPFFKEVFKKAQENTKLFAHIYTCCDWHSAFSLQAMAREAYLTEKNLCIWDKGSGGVGAMYQHCYEMIWFHANSPLATTTMGKKKSGERTVNGKPNIWSFKREKDKKHNAQKPIEMICFAIENSSDKGEVVMDLFLGSGSTLIACETTNRICRGIEIDPGYVQVCVQRWIDFTEKSDDIIVKRDGKECPWDELKGVE